MAPRWYWSSVTKALLTGVATVSAALSLHAAPPQIEGGNRTYENCMNLAHKDPDGALEAALAWQDMNGGGAARHCGAVALFNLGQYQQAAKRFKAVADAMGDAPSEARAAMLAQAGAAWFRAEQLEKAYAIQSAALKLAPNDSEILIDRATTLGAARNYWEAIDDLNQVIEADPERTDALILRASAYRFVDALPLAQQDVDAAYRLAPGRPEVLLEYGILKRLAGDLEGARQTWLELIRLHDGTPAAGAAQRNLELLDVKLDRK